jgi:hypothetical protein
VSKPISQREARQLRKRVQELEAREDARRRRWSQEWFGGVNICSATWEKNDVIPTAIRTARLLGHAVVALGDDGGQIRFMALPLAQEAK